jgi:hypothetical protein
MTKDKAKSLADFKSIHDPDTVIPNKIRAALADMLKLGAEHWEYESDFVQRAGVSMTQLGQYRDGFMKHLVKAPQVGKSREPRNVWFADPKVATKVRGDD